MWHLKNYITNTRNAILYLAGNYRSQQTLYRKHNMNNLIFFPNPEQVFAQDAKKYNKVLFPIFSVKLSEISGKLGNDYIHLIQFNEDPYNTNTVKYFTDYCQDCMISFDFEESKYTFSTDLKFFDLGDDWIEWFEKTKETYLQAKEMFKKNNKLIEDDWIQIGGKPNWIQNDETPCDPDGIPMTFIAQFDTLWLFDDSCPKVIYLFYSQKHKLAVQLYQIT